MRWSNIVKTVELKDNAGGLIKSNIDGSGETNAPTVYNGGPTSTEPNHKIILNQISGQANPGEILALMGPSGSGKTSLLDVLSSRSIYQDGTISLNSTIITDRPEKVKALKRKTAYIKQQDIFFEHLTVKDQLTYTAFLRLGDEYTKEEKRQEVSKVISLLRLNKCEDTPIRLISGGERKRANIGTELLTNPDIIMLDEPTSGLDSSSAVALLELLVSLAHDHGKTVITSIHQPSSAVFHKFDNVLFLADGCVVYYGRPANSLDYCEKLGFPCPGGYNAADHWMDLLVEDSAIESEKIIEEEEQEKLPLIQNTEDKFPIKLVPSILEDVKMSRQPENPMNVESFTIANGNVEGTLAEPTKGAKGIRGFIRKMSTMTVKPTHLLELTKHKRDEYKRKKTSKAALINQWDVDAFAEKMEDGRDSMSASNHSSKDGDLNHDGHHEVVVKKFNTSWSTQFYVLLHRALKNSRAAILTPINICKSVALGILTGLLWFQMPYDETRVSDRASFLFFSITYWVFDSTFSAIFAFPMERTIIFKERASGSYQLSAYFLSKTLSEMPTRLMLPTMFWTVAYWMAAVNPRVDVFLGTLGCSLLAALAGESFGLLCGALVMDFEKAMTIMIIISLTQMAAGGFYVKNIPSFLVWIKYISPFKPGYEAAQVLVFDRNVPCDAGSDILAQYCTEGVQYATPDQVLNHLAAEGTIGGNIGILCILVIVPRYLAFLALRRKKGAERS